MNKNNNSFCRKGLVSICFIGIILFTQLWYVYPVVRHPKLHYWAFFNAQAELKNQTKQTSLTNLCNAWDTAIKSVDFEQSGDSALFIDIYGATRQALGCYTCSGLLKLDNGIVTGYSQNQTDFSESEQKLYELKQTLDSKNIPLLFVIPPTKIHDSENLHSFGLQDKSNENLSRFISMLKKLHIDYIDTRTVFADNPDEHYRLFFKSDHHWQPKYSFYAYALTAEKLNKDYGFHIDPELFNPDNFQEILIPVEERPYFSIGVNSQRKMTGRFFAPHDEYILFEPRFETDSSFGISDSFEIHKSGNHRQTWRQSGIYALQKSTNNLTSEKKILLIKDSYGVFYFDYLSLACNELWALDMRNYRGDYKRIIDQFQPDAVIMIYSLGFLNKLNL